MHTDVPPTSPPTNPEFHRETDDVVCNGSRRVLVVSCFAVTPEWLPTFLAEQTPTEVFVDDESV